LVGSGRDAGGDEEVVVLVGSYGFLCRIGIVPMGLMRTRVIRLCGESQQRAADACGKLVLAETGRVVRESV
jgi:hypothetical protein